MEEKIKFLLTIDDVFDIFARGIVVTGKIEIGEIKSDDMLELVDNDKITKTRCKMLEKFRRIVNEAKQGDYIAICLADVTKLYVKIGMKLVIRK